MRILLLSHAYNSLTQRLDAELRALGHTVTVELDIADAVTEEAVALFRPDVLIAPYLRRAIPEAVWSRLPCLVVHPGIVGDRGPSALDWAVTLQEQNWGVTVLQAESQMDAGPIWATQEFPLRAATKASLYRNEVTQAASVAVLQALLAMAQGQTPTPLAQRVGAHGQLRPLMKQDDRRIDWVVDSTATVLRKLRAADSFPGVADTLFGEPCHLFDACEEAGAVDANAAPGTLLALRETALLRRTVDGAVWIGHVKRAGSIKLPATLAFEAESAALPETPLEGWWRAPHATWQDIAYEEDGAVGTLHFAFYNGAMSARQCQRLEAALAWAKQRPTRVLVLAGGPDFWSNGIHLNVIEAASLGEGSAADESWDNINAMNDLTLELIHTPAQLTVAALGGNAGAGGCFLARAADQVWVRSGVMLNPHYKNMGNLYGSEYWTYLLPKRVGLDKAQAIMRNREPLTAQASVALGLYDACLEGERAAFVGDVQRRAQALATASDWAQQLERKNNQRAQDEATKPLADYRAEELA
ncbi:MAG: hypothetical protein RLZ81_3070, partial [Pseudomonadota bacterium]